MIEQPEKKQRVEETTRLHKHFFDDIFDVIQNYMPAIDKYEIMAITSQVVGNLAAMQDDKYSSEACLETIQVNIMLGNKQAVINMQKLADEEEAE